MEARATDAAPPPVDGEVPGYRPVSRLAVASLVLGVLSGLTLVGPFFFVVPLAAVAVAVVALADVAREGAPKAGRFAALAGLALAIGFGAQATTGGLLARWIDSRRAAAAAQLLVESVRDGQRTGMESMVAPDALDAVAKLAACAGRGVLVSAAPGEEPGTWLVRLEPREPGGCSARLTLSPSIIFEKGRSTEQWIVTACELDGQPVRPSGK